MVFTVLFLCVKGFLMLKIYELNGLTFQWHEGDQPDEATLIDKPELGVKRQPAVNKRRTVKNKTGDAHAGD
ncbi:hypothetical protein HMPREF9244_01544 [Alloscardovia omnicolens F0580]|uniref:Uncharacterized protein n=2 Tax=Alloscardovia omnicolens TaxID=419015 RepID=U1R860_9BIFI|nr:hypothetical protein HMPREF9244_01544 [Alloscardovia omnicolens F0580]